MSVEESFMESLFNCCCGRQKTKKYNLIETKILPLENNDVCSICLEDFTENITILPKCNHKFHKNCITDWFKNKMICPLCKTSYTNYNI